jgi:hypothetical protein
MITIMIIITLNSTLQRIMTTAVSPELEPYCRLSPEPYHDGVVNTCVIICDIKLFAPYTTSHGAAALRNAVDPYENNGTTNV